MSITDKTVLKMGSIETENIKTLQKKLGIKTDGFYGPVTRDTVKAKQKALGLYVDGIAGPVTLRALGLLKAPTITAGPLQKKHMAIVGVFTTFTGFYNKIYNYYRYGYYFNGQLSLQQEIDPKTPKNCVDLAQLLHALAHEMKGYLVRFIGIFCPVDEINHAYIEIKGGEFGENWTAADGAAAAKNNYKLGTHWCSGAKTVNPAWIPSEDL
ncbi:peptidoglycan-binding protein [Methanobacterium sp. SMA-27]|uniref:peptidoglycan-binding domain-containing protein n=1 Tax=Methanobacterium sp. SMA-27 TaxID=1495336 RepID=UPI0006944902|nr:peptidoglycan-binding domain-containing protein [Methanobacterium sp. SMA-27]